MTEPTSPQAAPSPSLEENDRQAQIDAVRAELEGLKDILEERDEVKGDDIDYSTQQAKLDVLDKNVEDQISKTSEVFAPIIEAQREEDKALIEKFAGTKEVVDASTLLDIPRKQYNEAQADLVSLAKELNASHLDDEIKALEGNPEKNPPSFMATLLLNMDSYLNKFASSNSFGERGKGFTKMMYRGMSQFVLSLFEKFSSFDVMGMKYEWMTQADKNALADRRFADEIASLNGEECSDAQKKKYYSKYFAWLSNQKGDRPSLLSIVAETPITTENVVEAEEKSDVFPDNGTERIVNDDDEIIVTLGSSSINLKKNEVSLVKDADKIECSFILDGTPVSVDKVTRQGNSTNESGFTILAKYKEFTFEDLRKAFEKMKESEEEQIAQTGIYLKKETA